MAILGKYTKQPRETESYTIDYTDDLTDGDEIISCAGSVSPEGIELMSTVHDGGSVRVWLRGGTVGVKYKVEVIITTGDGRVLEDEFVVTIKEY